MPGSVQLMSNVTGLAMERSEYLRYGGNPVASFVNLPSTLDYLVDQGFGRSTLSESRKRHFEDKPSAFSFDPFGTGYCDFCFAQLKGGEYDELQDGRQRCVRCSRSVIGTEKAFRDEFDRVKVNMESAFGISLKVPTIVKMVNAREIARYTGETFTPTESVNPRVVGFFERKGNTRTLYIENGAPRLAAVTTMAHEFTHVWQDTHWQDAQIEKKYGRQNVLPVREGMAVWAQVQFLFFTREFSYARRQWGYALARDDEYGLGFRAFLSRYPLSDDGQPGIDSPFAGSLPL